MLRQGCICGQVKKPRLGGSNQREKLNDSWKIFHEMFLQILDRVAPVKNIRLKQRDGTVVYWGYIKKYECQRQSMETVQGAKSSDILY